MRISDILRNKGSDVVTIRTDATLADLLDLLAEHRIRAVVVSDDGTAVAGIVSEHDVVGHVHRSGMPAGQVRMRDLMTPDPVICSPEDKIEDLARAMTDRRVRHLPVVVEGSLVGIVSIGDLVKQQLDHLQHERDQLINYVQGG